MKLSTYNPHIMKKATAPVFYFSAYPLKALNLPEPEKKSYLHLITRPAGKATLPEKQDKTKNKYAESPNVFPMRNVYDEKEKVENLNPTVNQPTSDSMEEKDSDWYASYE